MERSQKEYYLNEQMRAIQKELGGQDEFKQEILHFEEQIKKKKMSKEATEKAQTELRKFKMMSPMSAEATVVRNYIEWLLSLPWQKGTKDRILPSIKTSRPFLRYFSQSSARERQVTILCHSVFVIVSPSFLRFSEVAKENVATAIPEEV